MSLSIKRSVVIQALLIHMLNLEYMIFILRCFFSLKINYTKTQSLNNLCVVFLKSNMKLKFSFSINYNQGHEKFSLIKTDFLVSQSIFKSQFVQNFNLVADIEKVFSECTKKSFSRICKKNSFLCIALITASVKSNTIADYPLQIFNKYIYEIF